MLRSIPIPRQHSTGVLYTLLGAVCFGTTGTIQAFAPEGCQPLAVGTMRLVVGGLVMLLWVRCRSGFTHHVPWPKKATLTAAAGIGDEVQIEGNITEIINNAMIDGYEKGLLRKSSCHPLTRKNTTDNSPAIIHFTHVAGDKLNIKHMAKGGGSENMSRCTMHSI